MMYCTRCGKEIEKIIELKSFDKKRVLKVRLCKQCLNIIIDEICDEEE